jgi:putative hydrolase of the HAD superfamily
MTARVESGDQLIRMIADAAVPMTPKPTRVSERSPRLPSVRAVVFDIYGTLFISASGDVGTARNRARRGAFRAALSEELVLRRPLDEAAARAEEAYFAAIDGMHEDKRRAGMAHAEVDIREVWHEVVTRLREQAYSDDTPTPTVLERIALRYELQTNPTWPMPDMVETVERIAASMPVGIVSNAQFFTPLLFPALTGRGTADIGVRDDLTVYSFQRGEAKPSPKLFTPVVTALSEAYGVGPHEALYVGNDLLNDVWAASQHGMQTCLFAGDERSLRLRETDPVCGTVTPSCVVRSLPAILPILGIGD